MTVQKFILLYNDTFKYLREKYGDDAVLNLWQQLSDIWCVHLNDLIRTKGLDGMNEYWGGGDGTLAREKADCIVTLKNGVFNISMKNCPSVGEIVEHGEIPMTGNITYCSHCPALYVPIANKYGFNMEFDIKYSDTGACLGECTCIATAE